MEPTNYPKRLALNEVVSLWEYTIYARGSSAFLPHGRNVIRYLISYGTTEEIKTIFTLLQELSKHTKEFGNCGAGYDCDVCQKRKKLYRVMKTYIHRLGWRLTG